MIIQISQNHLLKRLSLSHLKACHSLKIIWHFMWVSFWNLLLFSIGLCFIVPVSHCFDDRNFTVSFEIRKHETSTLFYFSILLFIWGVYWISIWILGWIFTSLFFPFHAGCPMCWLIIVPQYSSNPYFCQIINNSLLFLILVIWAFFFLFFGQSR